MAAAGDGDTVRSNAVESKHNTTAVTGAGNGGSKDAQAHAQAVFEGTLLASSTSLPCGFNPRSCQHIQTKTMMVRGQSMSSV